MQILVTAHKHMVFSIYLYNGLSCHLEDENHWTIYTRNLFIAVKACVEPAAYFRCADKKKSVHYCATDSTEQHFEFSLYRLPYQD